MHQSTTPSLSQTIWPRWASKQFLTLPIVQTLLPVTFAYSLSSEAFVMRQLRRWKGLWRRSLTRSHKRTSMGPCRSCWNGTRSAYEKSLDTYRMYLVCDTNRLIGLGGRVFANGLGDLGSIPGCVIPETLKMVLDASLLNTQQYKVRIKGKAEQSRETSSALPYTSVL